MFITAESGQIAMAGINKKDGEKKMIGNKYLWSVALSVFLLGLSLQNLSADTPKVKGKLKEVQAALARFKDPLKAVRAGYLSTVGCVIMAQGRHGHPLRQWPLDRTPAGPR